MPQISRFYGIIISMYFDDHNPSHFHAKYGNNEVLISISDFSILEGFIPQRALTLVMEWASLHKNELLEDWNLVKNLNNPHQIEPLK